VATARADHDALYHRFFSDPAIVAQLLREFVAGAWLDGLDLDGMERGDPRWCVPLALRDLIGLPDDSPMWQWQPQLRYHAIDEGAFSPDALEGRDGLPALLFRLENSPDAAQLVGLADELLAWFAGHPGFAAARKVLVDMLGAAMAPHGPAVRVPEDLLEVRNMLATRVEEWKRQWLLEGERRGEERGEQRGEQRGEKRGEKRGGAALLLRQMERRFGVLPNWARDRVLAADPVVMEEWGLRVLDAATLEEVLA